MLARIPTALLAFILAGIPPLHGQDQTLSVNTVGPIATDRPAVTNSSVVVPAGSLQMKNGFLETSSQGQSILDSPESLVRFGVAKRTELRLTLPDYFHNLSAGGGSGFGDLAVGVKNSLVPRGVDSMCRDPVPEFPDRRQRRVQRRVRSGIANALVTRVVHKLDGGRDVLRVLAHSERHAKCDRRVHTPSLASRSAIDEALGCLHRVRGRLSGGWWAAPFGALRNCSQGYKAATDRLPCWCGTVLGCSRSLCGDRLFIPLSGNPSLAELPGKTRFITTHRRGTRMLQAWRSVSLRVLGGGRCLLDSSVALFLSRTLGFLQRNPIRVVCGHRHRPCKASGRVHGAGLFQEAHRSRSIMPSR